MNPRMLAISSVSCALLIGTPGLGDASMRNDNQIRGAEWQPERALTQNLPSPRYRSIGDNRSRTSRDQFRRTPDQYTREFNRNQRMNRSRGDYSSGRSERGHMLIGTVVGFQNNHVVVKTREGDRRRLHLGETTLWDSGIERGDRIIAKVRRDGHAIAVRKDRGWQGEHFVQPGASGNQNVARSARPENRRWAHQLMGTLLRFQDNHVVVNTREGDRQRLHVGDKTLVDAGIERGDNIIAYVRPDGHAIAIRKDRGRQGEHFVQPGSAEDGYGHKGRSERSSDFGRYRP